MDSDVHSLALLTLAVEIFILFPLFANVMWDTVLSLILAVVVGSAACYSVSPTSFLIYTMVMFFIIAVVPVIFILSLPYKRNLYGPWDEAVISPSLSQKAPKKYAEYAY
jgi:hypothetical protein